MPSPRSGPGVRRFARELGVDLAEVTGTGPKGRILKEDVQSFVKGAATAAPRAAAAAAPIWTCRRGRRWTSPSSARSRRAADAHPEDLGPDLARNWVMIPHVTQFDEADITELEAFRVALNKENEKAGVKVTMLAFLIKAASRALKNSPSSTPRSTARTWCSRTTSTSASPPTRQRARGAGGQGRRPEGRARDRQEIGELAAKARDGKLGPADMQGGTFSISSLGGIGGTAFTPIVNAPEVAILGVSRPP